MVFAPSNQDREPKFGSWVYQRPVTISKQYQDATPQSGTFSVLQCPKLGYKGHECSFHLRTQDRGKILGAWVYFRPLTILESISQCKNPTQEPPSSKAQNKDLKDLDVLCTFKIKMESQNSEHGSIKDSDLIQIKIKMPHPSQEPRASSKAPNEDMKDMDVLCIFKIKIKSHDSDHGCIKDQCPYANQDQDAKPQSETSSILQNPQSGLRGHGCSLHIQNQN